MMTLAPFSSFSAALLVAGSLLAAGCASEHSQPTALQPPVMPQKPASEVLVISATYGSGTHYVDVTAQVNALLQQPGTEFFARPEWLATDPTPGWNKSLVIVYDYRGRRNLFTAGEGGKVSVPALLESGTKIHPQ
jgi:hypothetical protein